MTDGPESDISFRSVCHWHKSFNKKASSCLDHEK